MNVVHFTGKKALESRSHVDGPEGSGMVALGLRGTRLVGWCPGPDQADSGGRQIRLRNEVPLHAPNAYFWDTSTMQHWYKYPPPPPESTGALTALFRILRLKGDDPDQDPLAIDPACVVFPAWAELLAAEEQQGEQDADDKEERWREEQANAEAQWEHQNALWSSESQLEAMKHDDAGCGAVADLPYGWSLVRLLAIDGGPKRAYNWTCRFCEFMDNEKGSRSCVACTLYVEIVMSDKYQSQAAAHHRRRLDRTEFIKICGRCHEICAACECGDKAITASREVAKAWAHMCPISESARKSLRENAADAIGRRFGTGVKGELKSILDATARLKTDQVPQRLYLTARLAETLAAMEACANDSAYETVSVRLAHRHARTHGHTSTAAPIIYLPTPQDVEVRSSRLRSSRARSPRSSRP